MTDFEREVIDRLGRIETKLDADYRALHGNGHPGLIQKVDDLGQRVLTLEDQHKHDAQKHGDILSWIAIAVAAAAAVCEIIINKQEGRTTMKKHIAIAATTAAITAAAILTGCNLLQDHKDQIHQAIIEALETKGQEAAIQYIDEQVQAGKLGPANAEKIKAAIPQGIERLKEIMKQEDK